MWPQALHMFKKTCPGHRCIGNKGLLVGKMKLDYNMQLLIWFYYFVISYVYLG